jgi:hypothetical protein
VVPKIDRALGGPSIESLEGPHSALSILTFCKPMVAIFISLLAFDVLIYSIRVGIRDRFEQHLQQSLVLSMFSGLVGYEPLLYPVNPVGGGHTI